MSEILTKLSGNILTVQFNRPAKENAITSSMCVTMVDILNEAAKDHHVRVVLWHGAGDSFCAGIDLEEIKKNLPNPYWDLGPQYHLINALINFDKPLVAAVHGAAIGAGTAMLMHCDFIYAGESAMFQIPFINFALVPDFGTTYLIPARIGHIRAAELILLGEPFDAKRAAELGLVTRVVPDEKLLATAAEIAQKLAEKPADALLALKRLMKQPSREQVKQAAKIESEELAVRLESADAKERISAFLEKNPLDSARGER